MNDPDPALLRDRDGERALGDGVHGSAHDRNVQRDLARELRRGVDVARMDLGVAGEKQNVVEGEGEVRAHARVLADLSGLVHLGSGRGVDSHAYSGSPVSIFSLSEKKKVTPRRTCA